MTAMPPKSDGVAHWHEAGAAHSRATHPHGLPGPGAASREDYSSEQRAEILTGQTAHLVFEPAVHRSI